MASPIFSNCSELCPAAPEFPEVPEASATPEAPHGFALLFPATPGDLQGYANDNGCLAESIVRLLPAECRQIISAASRTLSSVAIDIPLPECAQPERSVRMALETGHLPAIEWYFARGVLTTAAAPPPPAAMTEAEAEAETEFEHDLRDAGETVTSILAFYGHLAALEAAVALGFPVDRHIHTYAARNGHTDILAWLYTQEIKCTQSLCLEAAGLVGNLDTLKWAYETLGCPLFDGLYHCAARHGRLDILHWLHEQGCSMGDADRVIRSAARGGHMEALQWALAAGCSLSESTCVAAVDGAIDTGDMAVLQWLFARGCPRDLVFCEYIARRRNAPDVLAWLRAQRPKSGDEYQDWLKSQ